MKDERFNFSLKVWLTTAIIVPLLITLQRFILLHSFLSKFKSDKPLIAAQYNKFILTQIGMLIVSIVIAIPLFLAFYYVIIYFEKREIDNHLYKRYLSFVGAVLVLLPQVILLCYAIFENITPSYSVTNFFIYSFVYIAVILISIQSYKLTLITKK